MKKNNTSVTPAKIWQMLEKELADDYLNKLKKQHKIRPMELQKSERPAVKKEIRC